MRIRIIILMLISILTIANTSMAQLSSDNTTDIQSALSAQQIENTEITNDKKSEEAREKAQPFGSNLFNGNFAKENATGIEGDYLIQPGDKIAVQVWGIVEFNEILTVDGQGNLFIPNIGPVKVINTKNSNLNERIKSAARKNFDTASFGIYTNLLNVNPIAVYVTGFVNGPGRYAGIPTDSPLYFLDNAGGINPDLGSYRKIEIIRDSKIIASIDLYDFILNGKLPKPEFKDGDTILVRKRGNVVSLIGDVSTPTLLEFTNDGFIGADTLKIIPELSNATEITLNGMRNGKPVLETFPLDLYQVRKLKHGDQINIRADTKNASMIVKVEGAHKGASVLSVKRNAKLLDVLNLIEVDPEIADISAIHILRKSVAQDQKDAILDGVYRLEKSALLALSHSIGEATIRAKEAELTSAFVEKAKLIETLGRIVTSVDGRQQNITMEEGDVIVIPQKTKVVQINGEVFMTQAVLYNKNWDIKDYIKRAGGYTSRANTKKFIILRSNGETIVDKKAQVMPGDQILVPPKITTKMVQNSLDMTEILYKVAVAAGVIIRL